MQYSAELHDRILKECGHILDHLNGIPDDPVCAALLREMDYEVGGYNVYNIYDECQLAGDDDDDLRGAPTFLEWTIGTCLKFLNVYF